MDAAFLDLEKARALLDETQFVYERSWELTTLYPGIEGQAVAFLVACTRLCPQFVNYHDLAVISEFIGVSVRRMVFVAADVASIHGKRGFEVFEDVLRYLSDVLPSRFAA